MQEDIWKISIALGLAVVVGLVLDHTLIVLLITALAIIAWQVFRFNSLYKWVTHPRDNPLHEASGQLYQIYRELHRKNVLDRKRKRQLSAYLTQFRKAISAMPDAIVLIDQSGKIEWANHNAKSVLGIRWPEDSQVRFSNLIRYPQIEKLLSSAPPPEQGVEVHSLLNKEQTINIKCVAYTDQLRIVVARDVSRLIKVNKMHRDFVANVSHELKTPLTVLRGYIEIMQSSKGLPEKFVEPLSQMEIQNIRMQFIVNDLLYLAKLENSANIKPHEQINVTTVVNTIIEAVQPLLKDKQHRLELDINQQISVVGAPTELHSAFSNLVTNAIHYTPSNGLIKIAWQRGLRGAIFSVKDNGLGVPKQHLERLTQRFYRVDTDRSRDGGGTGLGLAIVKHVLQRHDSELEIESEEGVGSKFKCVFPATQIIEAPENAAIQRLG